jgi:hypothetical protein
LGRRGTITIAGLVLLASSALVWDPGGAAAAELVLEEPAACVTLDELAFRAERLLGQPLANVDAMLLSLRVATEATGFVARLEVARPGDAEPGVRSLRAASCAELVESLAIAIVVAIGDAGMPLEPPPAQQPNPAQPAVQPARSRALPGELAAHGAADGHGPAFVGVAWAIADSGTLPASTLGAGVGLGLSWSSLELRAIGTLLPEREGTLVTSDPRSPGVSIGLLAGGAVGCAPVALRSSSLDLALCAGAELGQLSGSGTRVLVPYQRHTLWAAARVELATRLALFQSPLALELLVTALAPFTRDEFFLKDLGDIHRPASVIGRLGLGLSLAVDGGSLGQ